ncbi:hypothetical protein EDC04DRAFT_2604779 [Pisolithus marmoratus]|nr:hypothetical protein EDC04DRAFT_2604779 [Pisolithus marmoratus]
MTKFLIAILLWHMFMAKPPFRWTTSLGTLHKAVFQRDMDLIEMFLLMGQYKDFRAWTLISHQYGLTRVEDSMGNDQGSQLQFLAGNGNWGKGFLCHMPLEGVKQGFHIPMTLLPLPGFWRSHLCITADAESLVPPSTDDRV